MHAHWSLQREYGGRRLRLVFAVVTGLALVEYVGGRIAGSAALVGDAGHLLGDAFAYMLAYMANAHALRTSAASHTREECLAAIANAALLLCIACGAGWHVLERFRSSQEIDSTLMLCVACVGLGADVLVLRCLHGIRHLSVNTRGAWVHALSDMLSSVAVIVASITIRFTGWTIVDPIVGSLIVTALVTYSVSLTILALRTLRTLSCSVA